MYDTSVNENKVDKKTVVGNIAELVFHCEGGNASREYCFTEFPA